MSLWFFVSDLHGQPQRYLTLFDRIASERPEAVLLGGDLFPAERMSSFEPAREDFIDDFLVARLMRLRAQLGAEYPRVLLILGNDDPRTLEAAVLGAAAQGAWEYANERVCRVREFEVYGYAHVPPTP
ncbi:MAG: metallophosphoesterase, partial [Planctomycetes bacterium]|nr:metallophosphoesterase [Planctomycetota bacterium]